MTHVIIQNIICLVYITGMMVSSPRNRSFLFTGMSVSKTTGTGVTGPRILTVQCVKYMEFVPTNTSNSL